MFRIVWAVPRYECVVELSGHSSALAAAEQNVLVAAIRSDERTPVLLEPSVDNVGNVQGKPPSRGASLALR